MFFRPGRAGLNSPTLHPQPTRLGRLARQPGHAVMGAACGIPLGPQMRQARLTGLRVGQHQGPARRHPHRVHGIEQAVPHHHGAGLPQQLLRLHMGQGQQHGIKPRPHRGRIALGMHLPALGVQAVSRQAMHLHIQMQAATVKQGLRPMAYQGVHARCPHMVEFTRRQRRLDHASLGVQHPHRIGTPGFEGFTRPRHGGQRQFKARVAHGEVLCSVVKVAKRCFPRGHAPAGPSAFFKHADTVTRLHQGASGADTGHTGPDDGKVFHGHDSTPFERFRRA